MATILRTYKHINFFTGFYFKPYQSNSHLKWTLKSNYAASHPNRNYATVAITQFINEPKPTPFELVENIKERYLHSKTSVYTEFEMLLDSILRMNTSLNLSASTNLLLEKNIQILIYCCGKAMKNEMPSVRSILLNTLWQVYKTTGLPLNLSHYNTLLCAYLENDQEFFPAEVLLEMNNNNVEPNERTYEYLLTQYCQKGNIEEANRILNFMKKSEIPINENIFSALLIGNAEAHNMNGALNILNIMSEMGYKPSSITYAALLTAYAKEGDIKNILKTFNICESKDIIILDKYKMDIVHHLALNGYEEHIDKILSTFSWDFSFQFENKNFISRLMQIKKVDVAIQVLRAIKKAGLSENYIIATTQPFARNIIKLDLPIENVVERLNSLEKEGFNIYEITLHYCMNDKLTTNYAVPLLRAWSETGFEVKEPFFWPLLANYGSENVEGVFDILQTMINEFSIKPSFDTLTRFVLPYIKNYNSRVIMEYLINNCKVPANLSVNAILYHALSKNKIESALQSVKNAEPYNVNYNQELLSPLLENAFKKTDDLISYNIIKKHIQGKQEIRKRRADGATQQRFDLLPTLYSLNIGFKLKEYSLKGDLKAAHNCIEDLKRFRRCKLPLDILLHYFDLLVKNDKLNEALQLLQDFSPENMCAVRYNKETRDQCTSSLSLLAEKGNVEGVNQLYDFLSKKEFKAMTLTEPLVQVHLVRNNPKAALDIVKVIHKKHGYIPARVKLMKALIEAEEVDSLQWLTDFSIKHQGESVTLLPLAVSFLKCQRERQCKRILESATSPIKNDLLRNFVNTYFAENDISLVKEFIKVTQGLVSINRNILYDMLLEKYSLLNNWEEGLALWNQMQSEKLTPSKVFMVILEELLKRNDKAVPSLGSQSDVDMEEQDDFYTKVTKMYFKTKAYPCREFLDQVVKNLIDAGNTEMIDAIENNWQNVCGQYLRNKPIKFEVCVKTNTVESYLQHVKKSINTNNNVELMKFINSIGHTHVMYLQEHSECINLFESLAYQIFSDQNISFFKPMLVVLSHYFLKGDQKALDLWNKTTKSLHQSYSSYDFLVKSFVMTDNFDQLPQLAERLHQSQHLNKRMFYEVFLKAYEAQNKYEEGLRILATFKPNSQEANQDKEENNDFGSIKARLAL